MPGEPHASGPVIREVAAAVIAELPAFADRLVERGAVEEKAFYARGDWVAPADMRQSFMDNARSALVLMRDGPGTRADWIAAPLATGRRRAEQGVPLEAVLHLFRLGTELLWDMLLAAARRRSPDELTEFVDRVMVLWQATDRVSTAMVEGYRSREIQLRTRENRRRERLIGVLVEGRGADPAVAADAETGLGLPAHGRYVVVLVAGDLAAEDTAPAAELAALGVRVAVAPYRDRVVWLLELGGVTTGRLATVLTPHLHHRAGMSGEVDGLAETGIAYRLAELALRTQPPDVPGVAVLDDRLPEALVAASPRLAQRLAARTLGRVLELEDEERDVLLETLRAWFRAGRSPTRAGELLYCHRNTVLNRLRKLEQLTGASLEDDRHQLCCRLALMAHREKP
ncbi:CdaR family transcriptional regulator [Amycolatopsis sp. CA-128772]|uniref:PucR family transcriptional regulator n=1 Tax=Amycolatopsis sp. CA-128772 TaxID=2073159 RepID=UPI001E5B88C7|nr:helix-turn-helix domain-containing protein [Amycolatopsis sp. CA-128772]